MHGLVIHRRHNRHNNRAQYNLGTFTFVKKAKFKGNKVPISFLSTFMSQNLSIRPDLILEDTTSLLYIIATITNINSIPPRNT